MKKLVLVILIAIITAIPCLAQEIEPEGIFSIEGTLWLGLEFFHPLSGPLQISFFEGDVYLDNGFFPSAFYFDTPLFSYFFASVRDESFSAYIFGVLFPLWKYGYGLEWGTFEIFSPVLFRMASDNWTPPEV